MKNLRNLFTMGILMGGLMANSAFASTGLMISDAAAPQPCSTIEGGDGGIIISDFTGIIISDFTGIIISDLAEPTCNEESLTGLMISD